MTVLALQTIPKYTFDQFFAVMAHCWLFEGVDKEGVRNLRSTKKCTVNPEWSTTPSGLDGTRVGVEGDGMIFVGLKTSAVVGNLVSTFLVEVKLTPFAHQSLLEKAEEYNPAVVTKGCTLISAHL